MAYERVNSTYLITFKTKQLKKYYAFHFTTVQQTFNFDIYLPRYAQRHVHIFIFGACYF